jgi:hypothetical protein
MKIHVLYDATGTIHALFVPSGDPSGPQIELVPAPGHNAGTLDVPAHLQHLEAGALHKALKVDVAAACLVAKP